MAAPDDNRLKLCDKCFASVEPDAPFCAECGAALSDGPEADGSDVAIYPELARANLLRMRGDYRQAEEVCLGLLRRYPNNATANTLLGDICAERGDLEQAAEWYDLALDIVSGSDAVRQKLAAVKQRLAEREAALTAKQIGLPARSPRIGLLTLVVIAAILAVGVAAYLIGRGAQKPPLTVETPIDVTTPTPEPAPVVPGGAPPTAPKPPAPWNDVSLAASLAQKLPNGQRLLDAWQDPRSMNVTISMNADAGAPLREFAANAAAAAMQHLPAAPEVTVRVIVAGTLAYIADVPRVKVDEVSSDAWKRSNAPNPEAWIDAVLTNEWPSEPPPGDRP